MSRRVKIRYCVTGKLVALTSLHVGGLGVSPGADLTLAVNGQGNFYIPGTSLSGALRAWWRANLDDDGTDIWGRGPSRADKDDGFASHVFVEDAKIDGSNILEIRNGVGIDRYFGRAADAIKYDREVLPRGTRLSFELTLTTNSDAEPIGLKRLINALQQGEVSIGAALTRGLGAVRLEDTRVIKQDLASRQGILARLTKEEIPADRTFLDFSGLPPLECEISQLVIELKWHPDGPLMVKAAVGEGESDAVPLRGATEKELQLVLPGSSIKGALRSHAERIMATVLDADPLSEEGKGRQRFLNQVSRFHLVNVLFGTANAPDVKLKAQETKLGRGALRILDCYALSGIEDWEAGIGAKVRDKPPSREPSFERATHIAIDRWTGGPKDGALFTVLEPWGTTWEPIKLRIDKARLAISDEPRGADAETVSRAALALLHLVLRDFRKGQIPLGFATNRGMGAVCVEELDLERLGPPEDLKAAWLKYLGVPPKAEEAGGEQRA